MNAPGSEVEGTCLRVGITYPPTGLDDPLAMDTSTVLVTSPVFETCFESRLDPERGEERVLPLLFEGALERVDDTGWRGRPVPGLRLSSGEALPSEALAHFLRGAHALRGIEVVPEGDSLTFRSPTPIDDLPHRLSSRSTLIAVRRDGRYLGTGPFMIGGGEAGRIVLERNPHHRGPGPGPHAPRRIEFVVLPRDPDGEAHRLGAALGRREVDITFDLGRGEVEQVQGVRRIFRPGDSTCLLSFNVAGAFAAAPLRRAAALALDRHAIADLCYQNPVAYAARGLLPPQLGRVGDALRHDPEQARALVAAHPPGRPLRMLRVWAARPYLPRPAAVAHEIVGQLGDVGLEVADEPARSPEDYHRRLSAGDYDLVLGGWIADSSDPAEFLESVLHSSMIPSATQSAATACNMARVADPELDRRLAAYRAERGEVQLRAIQAQIDELRPLVPLMYGASIAVHGWRVRGLEWKDRRLPNLAAVELSEL